MSAKYEGSGAEGLRIYNLFPRLVGEIDAWYAHVDRAADMKFNAVYINPFHYPGFSGSLYAPKNFYEYNPLFLDRYKGDKQLKKLCAYVHKKGMRIIMDLVINHTAVDCDLIKEHPLWYKWNKDGSVKNPSAMDPADARKVTVWGDLAEIDNEGSQDLMALWAYWKDVVAFYMRIGFDGFRCDAAYHVPVMLWEVIIPYARAINDDCIFIAETLGCEEKDIVALAKCGFEYVYNSSKWWDFAEEWFPRQYVMSKRYAPSLSFPETHDTERLFSESGGNVNVVKMRYAFSAFLSKGLLMPMGYEFCFSKRMNVVTTTPSDWESTDVDVTAFITRINSLKKKFQIFNEDCAITYPWRSNPDVFMMRQVSEDECECALIMINLNCVDRQFLEIAHVREELEVVDGCDVRDVSIESPVDSVGERYEYWLEPGEVRVLIAEG